jgi:CAAX protease family protein
MNTSFIAWLKTNDLLVYFVMVFLFMWPRGIVNAAVSMGLIAEPPATVMTILTIIYLIGTPMVAAMIIAVVTRNWGGLKDLFARVIRWRAHWQWYAVALFTYPTSAFLAFTLSDLIKGQAWSVPQMWQAGFTNIQENMVRIGLGAGSFIQILVVLFLVSIIVPLFEEIGWRAFAIPRLLEKTNSLTAALMIGLIWTIWHLPNFFIKDTDQYGMPFTWFLLTILAVSILMVWVMNHSNQSVFLTILFHASIILSGHFLPTQLAYQTGNYLALWLTCILLMLSAIIVIVIFGPQLKKGSAQ